MKTIHVRLFARAKDLAGAESVAVEVSPEARVGDLRRRLVELYPALAGLLERSALAVDNEFAEDARLLSGTTEIAVLPPVSGG